MLAHRIDARAAQRWWQRVNKRARGGARARPRKPDSAQPKATRGGPDPRRTPRPEHERDSSTLRANQARSQGQRKRRDELAGASHRPARRGRSWRADPLDPQRCAGVDRPPGSRPEPARGGSGVRSRPTGPILLIDADRERAAALTGQLLLDDFAVELARSAEHGRILARARMPELVLLG